MLLSMHLQMDRLNASSAQLRGLRSNMVVSCPASFTRAEYMQPHSCL